jgi:5-methylcytosine-specific restriction endonuclease McrA
MYVRLQVISRDKNICQVCNININEASKEWRSRKPAFSFTDNGEYSKWRKEEPKEEYHHVVEFAEGGLTTPENMITICRQCHRKVTAEFARNRAMKKKKGGGK